MENLFVELKIGFLFQYMQLKFYFCIGGVI